MQKKAVLFYYTTPNKYSFHALAGAIEAGAGAEQVLLLFIPSARKLSDTIRTLQREGFLLVICFSFLTPQLFEIADLLPSLIALKEPAHPDALLLIAGGAHATGDPEGTLRLGFDYVIRHEGEESIVAFIRNMDKRDALRETGGIAYLSPTPTRELVCVPQRKPIALDAYSSFSARYKCYGPIEIRRGCLYGCYYCQTPYITGMGVIRYRSTESILKETTTLVDARFKDIQFLTPDALSYGSPDGKGTDLAQLERLLQSVNRIIKPHNKILFGSFPSEIRPEHISEETLTLLERYTSNRRLVIGCQSGSQRILDLCRRSHKVETIYRAAALCVKHRFRPDVDFIFGLPGENDEDVRLTSEVMKDLVGMGARIHAHTFLPLPQTPYMYTPFTGLSPAARKSLNALLGKGHIFGQWQKQEQLAIRISAYFRSLR